MSWVDQPHREALLPLVHDLLAPQGVGYISYKAYPGWRIQDLFRDLMRYDARVARTPGEVIARARMALDFMHQCFGSTNDYDQFTQAHLAPLLKLNDAFLWHDFLSSVSHPVYFQEFMQQLGASGLQLLGDAQFGIRPSDVLDAESERQLAQLTPDPIMQEQLRDVVRNRALRQALVVQADVRLATTIHSEQLQGLRLLAPLTPEGPVNLTPGEITNFLTPAGIRVGSPLPLAKAALAHLGSIWPASISIADLQSAAADRIRQARLPAPSDEELHRMADNMVQCIAGQVVQLQHGEDQFVTTLSDRPVASPMVRWQASRGEFVTNRRHEAIHLDLFSRFVAELLDGTRDRQALLEAALAAVADGRLVVIDGQSQQPLADSRQRIEVALPQTLERFAQLATLIA
jgi:methyltransferase-like protein